MHSIDRSSSEPQDVGPYTSKTEFRQDVAKLGASGHTWMIKKDDDKLGQVNVFGLLWEKFKGKTEILGGDRTIGAAQHADKLVTSGVNKGWIREGEAAQLRGRIARNLGTPQEVRMQRISGDALPPSVPSRPPPPIPPTHPQMPPQPPSRPPSSDVKSSEFSSEGRKLPSRPPPSKPPASVMVGSSEFSPEGRKLPSRPPPIKPPSSVMTSSSTPVTSPPSLTKTPKPTSLSSPAKVTQRLMDCDRRYGGLQVVAQSIISSRDSDLHIELTPEERGNLPKVRAAVEKVESSLMKFETDFNNVIWHGRLSQQRIAWQNPEFRELLKDPLAVKFILLRAKAPYNKEFGVEKNLGEGNKLSSLLLYGLASNQPSYLISAAPNWAHTPAVGNADWRGVTSMVLSEGQPEIPRKISAEEVETFQETLEALNSTLQSIVPPIPVSPITTRLKAEIHRASIPQLMEGIASIVNTDEKARSLIAGAAGTSTEFRAMDAQCLEVMSQYDRLVEANKGDHAAVLGYGLISHALDARHLAAGLYGIADEEARIRDKREPFSLTSVEIAGRENLKKLLMGAAGHPDHKLPAEVCDLIKMRLQQVMLTILEKRSDLGLSDEDIFSKLQAARD